MGVPQFLAGLDLNPAVSAKLQTIYDTPDGQAPIGPPDDPDPTPSYPPGASSPLPNSGYQPARGGYGMIDMRPKQDTGAVPTSAAPKTPEEARAAAEAWGGADAGETAARGVAGGSAGAAAGASGGAGEQVAQATPGRYVPAHWQPGSRSEARREGFNPDELLTGQEHRMDAAGQRVLGADKHLEAAQQQGMADAVYAAAHTQASQQAAAQMQALQQQKEAYVQAEQQKLNDLSVKAQQKVDPDAAKGSSGAQLMAAIGIAMGQYGASITGGQNAALQIVNANIDRNIKAQEANIANAGKEHDRESSLYHQNLEAFGDRERATLATKMQYLDQVKGMADQQYALAKHTANEGQYHEFLAGVDEERAKAADDFAKLTHTQVETQGNEHYVPGQTVGGTPAGKPLENLVTLSDGTSVQMPNEKQQDKAIEKIQTVDKLQRLNNEALQARARIGKLDPILDHTEYSTVHKTLEDLEERKAGLLSTEAGQGVLRDSEYARAVGKQGFYTEGVGFFKGNPVAASARESADANLRRQIQRGDEDQRAFVKAAGGHIVKRGYTHDASGQLAPSAKYTGQDLKPAEQLAPKGSTPIKKGVTIPTADDALEDTTPAAPDFGLRTTPAAGGGKSKDKGGKEAHIHKGRK